MAQAIGRKRLKELLVYIEVKAGDVLFIPANTIHALGPGLLIYEIQQASDVTYRLYDWGRLGLDGQPRELHIDKGSLVANLDSRPRALQPTTDLLVDCEYFRAWRHDLTDGGALAIETGGRFQALTCIDGMCTVETPGHKAIELAMGETGLIPACFDHFPYRRRGDDTALQPAIIHLPKRTITQLLQISDTLLTWLADNDAVKLAIRGTYGLQPLHQ